MNATTTVPAKSSTNSPKSAQPKRKFFRASAGFVVGSLANSSAITRSREDRIDRHRDEEQREVCERVVEEERRPAWCRVAPELPGERDERAAEDDGGHRVDRPEHAPGER